MPRWGKPRRERPPNTLDGGSFAPTVLDAAADTPIVRLLTTRSTDAASAKGSSEDLLTLRGPIQAALERRGFELEFPQQLEDIFERDTQAARSAHLVAAVLLGIILYDVLAGIDYLVLPDVSITALLFSFTVVTPFALAWLVIARRQPVPLVREMAVTVVVTLASLGLVYLFAVSRAPLALQYHYCVILALLFSNIAVQLRFRYALVSSLVQVAAYTAGVMFSHEMPAPVRAVAIVMTVCAAVLALFANWTLERTARTSFLLSLRDRLFAADLERQNQRLQELSSSDPLTGVANRRSFEERMRVIWKRARISGDDVGLLRVEVDHFKRYTDTYGQLAADECIRAVADCLRSAVRATVDCLARSGAEEFIVVVPGCGLDACVAVAERMRSSVAELKLSHGGHAGEPHVTISVGVAAAKVGPSMPISEIIDSVGEAFVRAKELGRNRVEVAPAMLVDQAATLKVAQPKRPKRTRRRAPVI